MIQVPVTLSPKPLTWQRQATMVGWFMVLPVALVLYLTRGWPLLVLMVPVCAFVIYQTRQRLHGVRLTLETTGLRYVRPNYDVTVTWPEVRNFSKRMRGSEPLALAIVTTQGKYLSLKGFDRMDEIAAYIEMHANPAQADSITSLRLNPHTQWLFAAMFAAGVYISLHYPESAGLDGAGLLLKIAGIVGILWMVPGNLKVRQQKPVQRFFVLLGVWVAIVVVTLLVLDSFGVKKL